MRFPMDAQRTVGNHSTSGKLRYNTVMGECNVGENSEKTTRMCKRTDPLWIWWVVSRHICDGSGGEKLTSFNAQQERYSQNWVPWPLKTLNWKESLLQGKTPTGETHEIMHKREISRKRERRRRMENKATVVILLLKDWHITLCELLFFRVQWVPWVSSGFQHWGKWGYENKTKN